MDFITIKTIILGIIEGLTEYIPVSSTAHLLVAGKILQIPSGMFLEGMSICIQSGAILAAIWYFRKTIWYNRTLIWKVAVAFIPTGIAGLLLYPLIKSFLSSTTLIATALILGGIGLILIKPTETEDSVSRITYRQAFLIGMVQIFSFIPGISRAGATLIGGTLLGIPRTLIVPFSFLLAIPTILGASVVEARHISGLGHSEWMLIGLGTIIAFFVALLTMHFFIKLLTKKPLSWFGWYRIALGILIILMLA